MAAAITKTSVTIPTCHVTTTTSFLNKYLKQY